MLTTITLRIEDREHKELKIKVIKDNTTISDLLRNFIKEYLKNDKNVSLSIETK